MLSRPDITCSRHNASLQEEMETLLGKACKQASSSLHQMSTLLAADDSRRVCSVSITHMLCPDLLRQLDMTVTCLDNVPIILERTLQLGRENEFFFEVGPSSFTSTVPAALAIALQVSLTR